MKFESKLINPQFVKSDMIDIFKKLNIKYSDVKSVKQYIRNQLEVKFHDGRVVSYKL